MKTIVIAGNIGKDAVTRTTQGGDKITSWSVAVEERKGQDKRTVWFKCEWWGARGEKLAQYLTKGSRLAVAGEFTTDEYEGKTQLIVRVSDVTLMGGGQRDDGRRDDRTGAPGGGAPHGRAPDDLDDEIPF